MKNVIVIYGPTGVGKTKISIELAKKLNGEIISADSMQVYKHMDIGTAKIRKEEMQNINHYLIDIVEPTEEFSVYNFVQEATKQIDDIIGRKKIPIIVGGTGLNIKALTNGYDFFDVYKDENIREKYKKLAEEKGNVFVYNVLKEKWPEKAEKIKENDIFRIVRALEVLESQKVDNKEKKVNSKYKLNYLIFCLVMDREKLYKNINERTENMFKNGLVNEVKSLLACGVDEKKQSMQGIGYKEVIEYLKGNLNLEETKELIKKRTRNYAKRQFTFMNSFTDKFIIDVENEPELQICEIIKGIRNEND